MFRSRTSLLGGVLIAAAITLAACGGDDEGDNGPAPEASPLVGEWTPAPGEGPGPVTPEVAARPDPTNTPYMPPPESTFENAAELALTDLSIRLKIAPDQIEVLESDSALFLDDPLECPELADELQDVYYVYLQVEQYIYPYQAYEDPDAGSIVQACADVQVDQGVLMVPTAGTREALLDRIRADLTKRGVDSTRGAFRVVRPMTWTDTALGCRVDLSETPAPALIQGYLVVYIVGGVSYEYHADATGEQLEYCAPPKAFESADDLIATLQENEDLEVVVVEDEAAVYTGLNERGVLIEMTSDAYRVGLFDFDTPTAARRAAQRINDERVSRIFISGTVLIVQEENSPAIYSTLLNYAEEIRTPLLETDTIPTEEEAAPVAGPTPTLPPTPPG